VRFLPHRGDPGAGGGGDWALGGGAVTPRVEAGFRNSCTFAGGRRDVAAAAPAGEGGSRLGFGIRLPERGSHESFAFQAGSYGMFGGEGWEGRRGGLSGVAPREIGVAE
jgi:hypothetical protein